MPRILSRMGTAVAALAVLAAAGGCTHIRDHKGYLADQTLVSEVKPGIDNSASVAKTLGRPSFASQFDGGQTWYYVSRDTTQLAFSRPKPVAELVLAVRFDKAGNVTSVNKRGMEQVVMVSPEGGKTPTLGRHRGFFNELFGNIGRVGGIGQSAPTADNPTGGNGP